MQIPADYRFLYLHGFKSSPSSLKAQQMLKFFSDQNATAQIYSPQLPPEPAQAIELCEKWITQEIEERGVHNVIVVGSSLGGYYASWLTEKFGVKSILINPAIKPYNLLDKYLGTNKNYHDDSTFELTHEHMYELKALDVARLKRANKYMLMVQTGDETLDYRQAAAIYRQSCCYIEAGGSHGFDHFEQQIPALINFAKQDNK
jgi:predicted esterase YcpF (UPF0227 family)